MSFKTFHLLAILSLCVCSHLQAQDRPNVIVVLVDDMGYSDLGCYGGEIDTPNIDALAGQGLRFTQFYNQGRCCPTRASLMTGLQPHQTGIGHMTAPPGKPLGITGPYQGYLNDQCTTLASVLRNAGYHTLMTGKWHLSGDQEQCQPTRRGFDQFFGCLSGAINYFEPAGDRGLTRGDQPIDAPEDFYATDAFTDEAMQMIRDVTTKDDRPFFLYLAYNAPHWPLNAKWEDYQKYRGKYRDGWNDLIRRRNERQRELGILDSDTKPAPYPGPDWDSLKPKQRDRLDAVMAAYAACVDSVDQNIGKLVGFLDEQKLTDNTIIFFLSDNGACQEGGNFGKGDEAMVKNPPLRTTNGVRLGLHWAGACNTPYRKYKHFVHEGGACTPMIAHWPAGIPNKLNGSLVDEVAYLQDFMPTLMELAGGSYPSDVTPIEGRSMLPLLKGSKDPIHTETIFWEHEGNAAARDGDWKLVREYGKPWELYDMANDRTELNDLADTRPEVRDRLIAAWESWADRTGVAYPERFNMYEYLNKLNKTPGHSSK
ncbi:arylsulfatase [Crateriforma spongiae]|uniref:arylsulfatase n=1 Tax=Crateriforma spongiae TaxID=2724528 RepID=UPI0014488ECB|nr:arylsulfatase [Crateriforma spongiae]